MSSDDYEIARRRIARTSASADPYREEMWSAISRSWTEQAARRKRLRAASVALAASLALAAALLAGIRIGQGTARSPVTARAPAAELPLGAGLRTPYRLALGEHLRAVEMLLVAFDAAGDRGGGELLVLARELATTTRLLADSRAGEDAQVRRMLLDVELLLVQIGHLVEGGDAAERQFVREGIDESTVLPRLRQLVPERQPAVGI
jgi:hypothetical protein